MGSHSKRPAKEGSTLWEGLIARLARGDSAALAELYDATSHLVYGLAYRILDDQFAAEEVTLEVYTHAWRSAGNFQAERGSASAWLLTLARSRAIDALRARRRNRATETLESTGDFATDAPGPEEASLATERQRLIARALATLSSEQREAIELAYFRGLSHSEIAARLGQPLGTVKTRIRLGMARLRDLLAPLAVAMAPSTNQKTA